MTESTAMPATSLAGVSMSRDAIGSIVATAMPGIGRVATSPLVQTTPLRMTMSPPPAEPPTMPPPRAVAMRAKRATPPPPLPRSGPLRMTMSIDRRWSS